MSLYHPTGVTLKPRSGTPSPKPFPGTWEPPVTIRESPLCTLVLGASPKVGVREEDANPAGPQPPERIYLSCLVCSSWIH